MLSDLTAYLQQEFPDDDAINAKHWQRKEFISLFKSVFYESFSTLEHFDRYLTWQKEVSPKIKNKIFNTYIPQLAAQSTFIPLKRRIILDEFDYAETNDLIKNLSAEERSLWRSLRKDVYEQLNASRFRPRFAFNKLFIQTPKLLAEIDEKRQDKIVKILELENYHMLNTQGLGIYEKNQYLSAIKNQALIVG
jgi:hypothetical protein